MIAKRAYPNDEGHMFSPAVYNLQRWTTALRDIYVKVRLGLNKTAAKEEVVRDWPKNEQFNFSNWMKYYESGEVSKYKTASVPYYVNEETNYFLPNPPPSNHRVPSPLRTLNEIAQDAEHIADRVAPGLSKEEERKATEDFRRKLISRLTSLENHLGTTQGYLFAGDELEALIAAIYALKTKIKLHNRITLSAQTCLDLLVKEANILARKNCLGAADVIYKVAQTMPAGGMDLSLSAPPPAPMGDGSMADQNSETKTGLEGFLDNLRGAGITEGDELNVEDDVEFGDEVEMETKKASYGELVVEAQEMAPQEQTQQEVEPRQEQLSEMAEQPAKKSDFDSLVNSAFDSLTIDDLLKKLQDINIIFTNKEISKQLALADLMFSRLGLTPYFSNFSEVQQKNLDCINYSSTRMTDIIATLQGSLGKGKIDISKQPDSNDPEAQLLKRHLENEEQKDKEKKETRKAVEEQKLNNNLEKPELEVESPAEELAAPQEQLPPPPQPKRPVAPREV
jgi:hypothetical protein